VCYTVGFAPLDRFFLPLLQPLRYLGGQKPAYRDHGSALTHLVALPEPIRA